MEGIEVENFGPFEIASVSFALTTGYGKDFYELCRRAGTTPKNYLQHLVQNAVVTGELKK